MTEIFAKNFFSLQNKLIMQTSTTNHCNQWYNNSSITTPNNGFIITNSKNIFFIPNGLKPIHKISIFQYDTWHQYASFKINNHLIKTAIDAVVSADATKFYICTNKAYIIVYNINTMNCCIYPPTNDDGIKLIHQAKTCCISNQNLHIIGRTFTPQITHITMPIEQMTQFNKDIFYGISEPQVRFTAACFLDLTCINVKNTICM